MKAIIMAGGKGKRLLPLTEKMPKPLLTVGGVPAIRLILRLLKRNGINEAAVTVGYLGELIEKELGGECDGVRLTYFREEKPLGTAGGVKAAESFIGNDDFAVISGDAVCDADLIAAHGELNMKNADGLLILSRVKDPGEYGVVLCDKEGYISGFSEKPSLYSTCSDTVNTGIYIFHPSVLSLIPEDTEYDFGKDLFPEMLKNGLKLAGYVESGYWCDIGSHRSYLDANMRATQGRNTIGKNCVIGDSDIRSSVISDNCTVGDGCVISEAVVSAGCRIGNKVTVGKGAVIGPDCVISDGAVISPGARLPADSKIDENATVRSDTVLESIEKASELLDGDGISCPKDMLSVSFVTKLGSSLAAAADKGLTGIMDDGSDVSRSCAVALSRGLRVSGGEAFFLGTGFAAGASYASVVLGLDCAVFISDEPDCVRFRLFDKNGLYPKRDFERALLAALSSESIISTERPKTVAKCNFTGKYYLPMLCEHRLDLSGFRVRVLSDNVCSEYLGRALLNLGADFGGGTLALSVSDDGFTVTAEQDGYKLDDAHVKALLLRYLIRGKAALPVSLPSVIFDISGPRCLSYSHCPSGDGEDEARKTAAQCPELIHSCAAAIELAGLVSASGRTLKELCAHIPDFSTESSEILTDGGLTIISRLGTPDGDGVICTYSRGSVRVVPTKRGLKLSSVAASGEYARELMSVSKKEIQRLLGGFD